MQIHHLSRLAVLVKQVNLWVCIRHQITMRFRFDLSGIGDSETSSLGGYFTERSVSEIRAAIDFLQNTYHHKKFVLIGLCSGADDALATAQIDPRVCGVVLLNGYAYTAGKYKFYRFKEFVLPRLFMAEKWVNKIRRLFVGGSKGADLTDAGAANPDAIDREEKAAVIALDDDYRYIPPQAETRKIIEKLTAEGVQLFFVYSGSEYDTYTYEGQLNDMFPGLENTGRVREAYIKEADHTFILKADRDKLCSWVQDWFSTVDFNRRT